jgi:hypothetical protein
MQTVNAGGTTFGGQTNAGLEPSVGGNYAVFNAITMPTLGTHGGEFLEANPGANGAVIPSGYGAGSFDASGAAAARAAVGNCSAGQYGTATTTSGLTCAQVAYSQVSGTPTLPTIASTTNLLSGDGSGNAVSSGIAASNVPLLNAANTFTATNTFNNATYSALFTGGPVGIGTTNPGTNLEVAAGNVQGVRITSTNSPSLQLYSKAGGSHNWQVNSNYNDVGDFTLYDATAAVTRLEITSSGNVSIGNTTATSMFNVGTANQFQVSSTGVASMAAGSTASNGSTQQAICLADGTGGGVCGTSTPAFSAITSATNTTASMVVGTGGSLGVSGSGTISANVLAGNGVTNTSVASLGTGSLVPGSCINGGASAVTGTTASSVVTASLSATAAVMLAAPAQGIVVTALLSTDTHVPSFYVCDTTLTSWTYTGYSVAMQVH